MDTFVHELGEDEWESEPYKGKIARPENEIEMHGIGVDGSITDVVTLTVAALRSTEGIGEWELVQ